ncbi:unnamed protein product [Arctia plantaginis]|uniref:Uncharacterized protein n=1 Tax=Arctia plantaginis TaxID=874455 RepID=A0A8S1ASK9_ARCPL|nr:unnamed protein product [Arctia plantaginis]
MLMGKTESFIEDSSRIKISVEQRTLLRKLQNFQEPKTEAKALTWNEMLADALVNKIKIFSSSKVDENDIIKEYNEASKTNKVLTNYFSEVLLLYKNCIYDKFRTTYEEPDYHYTDTTQEPDVNSYSTPSEDDSPKSEIEIIEPLYHGKLQEIDSTEHDAKVECPEGSIVDEKGNCIEGISKLLITIPNQCPSGYRPDRLGNCRKDQLMMIREEYELSSAKTTAQERK